MSAVELECLYPRTPDEAVRMLAGQLGRVLLLAGGTTASQMRTENFSALMDIARLGLDEIRPEGGGWYIGCNVRVQQLALDGRLENWLGGLVTEAARSVASRPLRNMITAGGNAVQVFRWSDLPVAWLVCDAEFELLGPQGGRRLPASEFYRGHPRKILGPAEILLGIHLPERRENWGGAFYKLARTAFDLCVVDAAALVRLENGRCAEARVAVGGTSTLPWRSQAAERELSGKRPSPEAIASAAVAARAEARVVADPRTGEEYRRSMVEVMVRRALETACARAGRRATS